ncbi:YfgM family protein [Vibrio rumoiensis]|uniref:Ancillary SecYEG translocon subunit n=1 Tax=Vibrio rumoiensis TaxID=76258 RepID=A0ABW7ISH5_9VIBR|nr:tetratricopeptide repeat protein [Vibrio rumoiensis]
MSIYDADEEQQVEAIKDWWRANGKAVVIGIVVGIGGIIGWRYYQDTLTSAQEAASHGYTAAVSNLEAKGIDAAESAQKFIDSNDKTSYAVLTSLQLAKVQIDADKLDDALNQLKWAQAHTDDETLTPIIAYRTARVLAAKGDFDNAIKAVSDVKSEAWKARNQELMGDIYLLKGDKNAAAKAYTQAQQDGSTDQALQIKLDDLAK